MKVWTTTLAAILALSIGSSALAQCSAQKKDKVEGASAKVCDKGTAETCKKDKDSADCAGKMLAASGAPLMEYRIGEKSTKCQVEAMKWCEKEGSLENVRFVLCGKEYKDPQEAMKAYSAKLGDYLNTMTTVQYQVGDETVTCPKSAESMAKKNGGNVKFRVASYTFNDQTQADKAIERARAAADKVVMKKVVDGKEMECDPKACAEMAGAKSGCCSKSGAKTGELAKSGSTCNKSGGSEVASEKKSENAKPVANTADGASEKKTCNKSDGTEVAKAGKCEYVVGDMKTCCPDMAQVNLAQARIVAAYRVLNEIAAETSPNKGTAQADTGNQGT